MVPRKVPDTWFAEDENAFLPKRSQRDFERNSPRHILFYPIWQHLSKRATKFPCPRHDSLTTQSQRWHSKKPAPAVGSTEGWGENGNDGVGRGALPYSMVVTRSESLGSEARNSWSLVARTATKYFVLAFSLVMVKLVPVALVVAFVQRWPSSEYCTV